MFEFYGIQNKHAIEQNKNESFDMIYVLYAPSVLPTFLSRAFY